jgi:formylmethanofuran dehydrogenase subunit C
MYQGNLQLPLAEFFAISGNAADETHEWVGDLSGVHWLGANMTSGKLVVLGDAGRHVGSQMRGGEISVQGNAGDWLGAELHGGLIQVTGKAGDLVGSAYRGSPLGMTRGMILIGGDAGHEIGHAMRRGLIAVAGNIGDIAGLNMRAGTILVFGDSGIRHGAGMRRGTLALLGRRAPPLLPTFVKASRCQPLFMQMLYRKLRRLAFPVPESLLGSAYDLYSGDLLEGGRGEILVRAG